MKILCIILLMIVLIFVGAIVLAYAMYMEKKQIIKEQKEMVRKYKEKMINGINE